MKKRATEYRRIDELHAHPKQQEHFGVLDDNSREMIELRESIKNDKLRDPPRILTDGTIICGHRRVRACQLLGMSKIPVIVDRELERLGPAAIERLLIEDNLLRRQLDELEQARLFEQLLKLEHGRSWNSQNARDRLAARFGTSSGRTWSRRLQILRTPLEVQNAYRQGQLTLAQACRIERLPSSSRLKIAAELRAGKDVQSLLGDLDHQSSKNPNIQFVKALRPLRGILSATSRSAIKSLTRVHAPDMELLKSVQDRLRWLIPRVEAVRRKQLKREKQLFAKFGRSSWK